MNIYASKLFRTSPRKDRIRAAANNPINTELVIQLKNQLKDKDAFKDPDDFKPKSPAQPQKSPSRNAAPTAPSRPSSPTRHTVPNVQPKQLLSDKFKDAEEKLGGDEFLDDKINLQDDNTDDNETEGVESSTIIPLTPEQSIAEQVDSLAGTLNAADSTTGVRYAVVKDKEVWVYYNDGINLNNVMEAVIRSLASAGYNYLEFNRLARSNNAMVFTITESAIPLQPVE